MLVVRGRWGFSIAIPIVIIALVATLGYVSDMSSLMLHLALVLSLVGFTMWNDVNPTTKSIGVSSLNVTRFFAVHMAYGTVIATASLAGISILGLLLGADFTVAGDVRFSPNVILLIVLAAFFEELMFRGPIFYAIQKRFGGVWAVSLTSAIFGFAHMLNPSTSVLAIVNVTLAGLFLGVAVLKTKTLWLSTSFHVTWNLLVALCFGAVSGVSLPVSFLKFDTSEIAPKVAWLFGGSFGIEEGALTTLVLVIATIAVGLRAKTDVIVAAARLRTQFATINPETETI